MRNFWVQNSFTNASWIADVSPLLDHPLRAISLACEVLEAARDLELVVTAKHDACDEIRGRWEADEVVDALWSARRTPASAQMGWVDRSQTPTTGLVRDLGALLHSLEPVENSINDANRVEGRSPLILSGTRVDYVSGRPKDPPQRFTFGIETYSDIWFPYVLGMTHPNADGQRFFDNREIATLHTPRLNRFLTIVNRLVRDVGGSLEVDLPSSAGARGPWISDCRIDVDAAPPVLMPEELIDVEWPDLDD